jgi:hypothetical protein
VHPMNHSRHVVPGIVMLGMAAIATWNVTNNGDWTDPVLPVVGGLAVIWWAAGLGLLTGTAVGVWLGRLGATLVLVLGVYFGWDRLVAYAGPESWRWSAFWISLPLTVLLVGTGVGILVALRPRPTRRPATLEVE